MELRIKKRYLQNGALIIFGLILSLLILEIMLRAAGSVILGVQRHKNAQMEEGQAYRILTLGESTTANMQNGQSSWSEELEPILNNKSSMHFEVFNEGIGNLDTIYIISHLEENIDRYRPNMIIVMMGTNDRGLNHTLKDLNNISFVKNLRVHKLFDRIAEGIQYNFDQKNDLTLSIGEIKKISEEKFRQEGQKLKKNLEINPEDTALLTLLEKLYFDNGRFLEFEETAKRHFEMEPNDQKANFNLGLAYHKNKKYEDAENMYKNTILLNPSFFPAYVALVDLYDKTGRKEDAIKYRIATIQLAGHYEEAWFMHLAELYTNLSYYDLSYEILKTVAYNNPDNEKAIYLIGSLYEKLNKTDEAVIIFNYAIEKHPQNYAAYTELAWYDIKTNRTKEAQELLDRLKTVNSYTVFISYDDLMERYIKNGQPEKAEELSKKMYELRKNDFSITYRNYLELYKITKARGIKLVVMQYPTLDVNELKKIFRGDEDIIFISNKENFEEALKNGTYEEYFVDSFRRTWGHATKKGNRLIAENVANVTLSMISASPNPVI